MQITLIKGDITRVEAGALVNAANASLMGGGGVDGAIHRAGGPAILEQCKAIVQRQGGCPPGEAVATTAGNLHADYVIHTVGPLWHGGKAGEAEILRKCYDNSLRVAVALGVRTIAFPNISTGAYGYPKVDAASIAITAIRDARHPGIEQVIFVCFDEENFRIYQERMHKTWNDLE